MFAHFVRSLLAHSLRSFAVLLLTHFVHSLLALASLALLSLTSFAPHLLTHFVRSLHFRSLTSFVRSHFCRSLCSLLACSLTSFVRSCFCRSLCSLLACSLTSFVRCALPPYDLVFHFTLHNLSGGGCPLKSPIACTITFYNSLIPSLCPYCRNKVPILVHLNCPVACTITFFLNSLVQSLVLSLFSIRLCNLFVPKNFSIKL